MHYVLINVSLYCCSCRWTTLKGWPEWWVTNSWLCRRTVTLVVEWQQTVF